MALDYEAEGAAIAARFATASTPTGEDSLALCTAEPPDQLDATPAVIVFLPEETLDWGPVNVRHSKQIWTVRFFRTQGPTMTVRMAALAKWRRAFLDTVAGQLQLGLSYVDYAQINKVSVSLEAVYAETRYDCLEFLVEVKTREPVTAAA